MSTEHDQEDFEQDAIEFSRALVDAMQPYFKVRPYIDMELYQPGAAVPDLQNIGGLAKYVDTETIVTTRADYPTGMRLLDAIDTMIANGISTLDEAAGALCITSINNALGAQEIGFSEWRFLLKRLHSTAQEQGNFDFAYQIEAEFRQLGDSTL